MTDIHAPTLANAVYNARLLAEVRSATRSGSTPEASLEAVRALAQPSSNTETSCAVLVSPPGGRNDIESPVFVSVSCIDWSDPSTYPLARAPAAHAPAASSSPGGESSSQQSSPPPVDLASPSPSPDRVDVVVGSDLVYEDRILHLLVPTIANMLRPGRHPIFSIYIFT